MALLYILTGHKQIDDVMRNLDLNYMNKENYGEHIEQRQGTKPEPVTLDTHDRYINVLAHGDEQSIAGETGKEFARRLLDTFGKDQLINRTILIYSCSVAKGAGDSVLHAMVQELQQRKVKKTPIVGSVDETFTMSTGTMRVLEQGKSAEKLSKAVEDLRGHKRDAAAEDYLRPFRSGWRGYKIRDDEQIARLDEDEAGGYIRQF